jgi:hypothetical protein
MYKYFIVNAATTNVNRLVTILLSKTGGELYTLKHYTSKQYDSYAMDPLEEDRIFIRIKTERPAEDVYSEFLNYKHALEEIVGDTRFISHGVKNELSEKGD